MALSRVSCSGWYLNGNKFLSFRCALKSQGGFLSNWNYAVTSADQEWSERWSTLCIVAQTNHDSRNKRRSLHLMIDRGISQRGSTVKLVGNLQRVTALSFVPSLTQTMSPTQYGDTVAFLQPLRRPPLLCSHVPE